MEIVQIFDLKKTVQFHTKRSHLVLIYVQRKCLREIGVCVHQQRKFWEIFDVGKIEMRADRWPTVEP